MRPLHETYEPIVIEDGDDIGANRSANRPLLELAKTRMSRRTALKGFVTTAAVGALGGTLTSKIALAAAGTDPSTLTFTSLEQVITENHAIAPGYNANILIRWGDPVLPGAPEFDPTNHSAEAQAKQFGYNNDYLAYFPLPRGSDNSEHGLLHANHEYTNAFLMFPGWTKLEAAEAARQAAAWTARQAALEAGMDEAAVEQAATTAAEEADITSAITKASLAVQTPEQSRIEMMAHNGSVIEVKKENGAWTVVPDSQYARRISPDTEMRVSGPAAGHERLKTNADPTGTKVFGTINNCAGGKTPWGTVMMAEENFHGYFGGGDPDNMPEARNYKRYGVTANSRYAWWRSQDRFNLEKEPNEPNRFGWMVEYDPYDPSSVPVKRTALGRFKHEGATSVVNKDGRVVFYSGDDERFDYLYRFVTAGRFDPDNLEANRDLLDEGTLSVAKFDEDKCTWLPLVYGEGPLTEANDFHSQADVLIETRRAADLVGATPMDRPEDVEPNPVNGRVYVMLTNNTRRKEEQVDAVNPRAANAHGQVAELIPPGGAGKDADHAADQFDWDLLLIAGNPNEANSGTQYSTTGTRAWLSSPDNCAFDSKGRIWFATDSAQQENNIPDGLFACDIDGEGRAYVKFFFACPIGGEMCGPEFTPDGRTLFVAVMHPAQLDAFASTYEQPATRWPDFAEGMPPRPALVVITKDDGGPIGS
jgi:secreted PhoX family phosphatase